MKPYAGRCYGGPRHDQWVSLDRPWFCVPQRVAPPFWASPNYWNDSPTLISPAEAIIEAPYVWHESINLWIWHGPELGMRS